MPRRPTMLGASRWKRVATGKGSEASTAIAWYRTVRRAMAVLADYDDLAFVVKLGNLRFTYTYGANVLLERSWELYSSKGDS